MASNIDKYTTPLEHSSIDHTGLPGVGVVGSSTVVGAVVLFSDANPAGQGTVYTVPLDTLTVDDSSLDITIAFTPGNSADPTWVVTLGGQTLINWATIPVGVDTIGHARIRIFRTNATTGLVTAHAWVAEDDTAQAGYTEVYNNETGITVDWATALALTSNFSGGMNETIRNFHVLKWPEAGSLGLTGIGSDTLPTGTIVPYGGAISSVPAGFLPCDGSLADQTVEADLFGVIGTIWNIGGEPGGFFRLPDFRGKSLLGLNDGSLPAGIDGGFTARGLATLGGEETHQLTVAELAAHNHYVPDDSSAPGTIGVATNPFLGDGSSGFNTYNAGSNTPHNTMQPFAVCLHIIKA